MCTDDLYLGRTGGRLWSWPQPGVTTPITTLMSVLHEMSLEVASYTGSRLGIQLKHCPTPQLQVDWLGQKAQIDAGTYSDPLHGVHVPSAVCLA